MTAPTRLVEDLRRELLGGKNPFEGADPKWLDDGYPHTFLPPNLVKILLEQKKPSFWLEIGSMVGGSARIVASLAERLSLDTSVVCLDPFTADVGAWENNKGDVEQGVWDCLCLEYGRPRIYERFLANVAHYAHRVHPLVMTSSVGCALLTRLFEKGRISQKPDVIYLDSAHEPGETFLEIRNAWKLLARGGVLFGDDWDWEVVSGDVVDFVNHLSEAERPSYPDLTVQLPQGCKVLAGVPVYENQWILCKP